MKIPLLAPTTSCSICPVDSVIQGDAAEGVFRPTFFTIAGPVARRSGRATYRIGRIWVDSPASLVGGRSNWGIPKELADIHIDWRSAAPPIHMTRNRLYVPTAVSPRRAGQVEARLPAADRSFLRASLQLPLGGWCPIPVSTSWLGPLRGLAALSHFSLENPGELLWVEPSATGWIAPARLELDGGVLEPPDSEVPFPFPELPGLLARAGPWGLHTKFSLQFPEPSRSPALG